MKEYGYDVGNMKFYSDDTLTFELPANSISKEDMQKILGGIPIVRCKDCKHCDKVDDYEYWCNGRGFPRGLVAPDGFCDKGEI